MQRVLDWFSIAPTPREAWRLIWRACVLELAIVFIVLFIVFLTGAFDGIIAEARSALQNTTPDAVGGEDLFTERNIIVGTVMLLGYIILGGIVAPFVEEFIFRMVPIGLAILIFGRSRMLRPVILLAPILAGVAFGLVHLSNPGATLGTVLLYQTIGGIIYGLVFAKFSGMQRGGLWRAYRATVFLHATWNLLLMPIIAIILGMSWLTLGLLT